MLRADLLIIHLLFRAVAEKQISYSSCFCPPFSIHDSNIYSYPHISSQCWEAVPDVHYLSAGPRLVSIERPSSTSLLHSHCMACKVTQGFIFKDTTKLSKSSKSNVHHPRAICGASNALVVPSKARAMRIYIKTFTDGQVMSVNSESRSQILGNTTDAAQCLDELNVFGQARCPK